ncbi:MAG: hypothetical protein LBH43_20205 [Treponema sp.]|jgi:hypothetical protein|nr:hypothetical protein [Treponema sp.]
MGCNGLTSVTFEGTIPSNGFETTAFGYNYGYPDIGGLRDKFYKTDPDYGTPGTYTTANPGPYAEWTLQP